MGRSGEGEEEGHMEAKKGSSLLDYSVCNIETTGSGLGTRL